MTRYTESLVKGYNERRRARMGRKDRKGDRRTNRARSEQQQFLNEQARNRRRQARLKAKAQKEAAISKMLVSRGFLAAEPEPLLISPPNSRSYLMKLQELLNGTAGLHRLSVSAPNVQRHRRTLLLHPVRSLLSSTSRRKRYDSVFKCSSVKGGSLVRPHQRCRREKSIGVSSS